VRSSQQLSIEPAVKNQLDKNMSHTNSEVGGQKRAEARAEIGAEKAAIIIKISKQRSELDDRVGNADRWSGHNGCEGSSHLRGYSSQEDKMAKSA
jgi:hypothetical protein